MERCTLIFIRMQFVCFFVFCVFGNHTDEILVSEHWNFDVCTTFYNVLTGSKALWLVCLPFTLLEEYAPCVCVELLE